MFIFFVSHIKINESIINIIITIFLGLFDIRNNENYKDTSITIVIMFIKKQKFMIITNISATKWKIKEHKKYDKVLYKSIFSKISYIC